MIYYLVADEPEPSWGTGMLYEHVRLLCELGFEAVVLHHCLPYRPAWRELDVPVCYLDDPALLVSADDVVVVPEVLAGSAVVSRYPWRRVVFVQGGFLIVGGLGASRSFPALGYEAAMAVLPHIARIVERHFGLPASVVPPFVAPYFFEQQPQRRERRLLLAVKDGYRLAGIPDGTIAERLLETEISRRPDWSLVKLRDLDHRAVAELMQTSWFLINVNSHEAFNTTVPEAMAAGCVVVCYEAGGGRDFLCDGENAIVFPNQRVFDLVERVCELMDGFESETPWLARLQTGGRATARYYSSEVTADRLRHFFGSVMCLSPT